MERRGTYDEYAAEYAREVARLEDAGVEGDPLGLLPRMLGLLGNLNGLAVLDAGCGEGYLARILSSRGAEVTGIDVSPRLVSMAREKDPGGAIDYRVADLGEPLPDEGDRFDAVASRLALNDVPDHEGFIATLAAVLKPGGRMVLAMNNPYSYVVRKHISDYFETGGAHLYRGMAQQGVGVRFYHRTFEEYLDAFLAHGLRLTKLVDVPRIASNPNMDTLLPEGYRLPFLMILAFEKPKVSSR